MWKRSHGRTRKAPPDERGGKRICSCLKSPRHISTLPTRDHFRCRLAKRRSSNKQRVRRPLARLYPSRPECPGTSTSVLKCTSHSNPRSKRLTAYMESLRNNGLQCSRSTTAIRPRSSNTAAMGMAACRRASAREAPGDSIENGSCAAVVSAPNQVTVLAALSGFVVGTLAGFVCGFLVHHTMGFGHWPSAEID